MATLRRTADSLTLVVFVASPVVATAAAAWFLPMTLAACESDSVQRTVHFGAWLLGGALLLALNLTSSYWAMAASGVRARQLAVLALCLLATTAGFALLLHATALSRSAC